MIRLIADDLTGALDTAAAFAGAGPVRVALSPQTAPAGWRGPLAIDTGNRDRRSATARAAAAALAAAHLRADMLAFCKVDSVLRGAPALDVAAAVAALRPARIVIAPAFPAQGRITRDGRQWRRDAGGWAPLTPALAALAPCGARLWAAGAAPVEGFGPGAHVCDAETDADLARVAQAALAGGAAPLLLVGAAGLAAALAALMTTQTTLGAAVAADPAPGPALLIFGTPHAATRAQIAALAETGVAQPLALDAQATGGPARAAQAMLAQGRPALLDLSRAGEGRDPRDAARVIDRLLAAVARMPPPPVAFIGGGATLAALLRHLRAEALDAEGLATPGVAQARILGGAWDGAPILTKSGGFGAPDLLARLLERAQAAAFTPAPPPAR